MSCVDHLGHGHSVVHRHEDIRRLDVPVDDPLLGRVRDGVTDLDEQVEPCLGGELSLVAVRGNGDAVHQFHDEEWPPRLGGAGIQDLGKVRMVLQRQRLPERGVAGAGTVQIVLARRRAGQPEGFGEEFEFTAEVVVLGVSASAIHSPMRNPTGKTIMPFSEK